MNAIMTGTVGSPTIAVSKADKNEKYYSVYYGAKSRHQHGATKLHSSQSKDLGHYPHRY